MVHCKPPRKQTGYAEFQVVGFGVEYLPRSQSVRSGYPQPTLAYRIMECFLYEQLDRQRKRRGSKFLPHPYRSI